jgi:peptide deformylase|tara:strand:- start:419 stop:997 length:579 start_codon:yes stop_codon:yes gene_type:complete
MIVKRIEKTPVTNEELNEYKEKISKLENEYAVNASDVGMDKRIVTIKFGGEYDELTLVNPKVIETSKEMVVYFEKELDGKQKIRKTARHQWFKIDTDNLGVVEFSSDKKEWKDQEEYMNDLGLFECITAQRLIDSIDGVSINSPIRRYSTQLKAEKKPGRNERVMLQSPEGEMEFVKYKKAQPLLDKGYKLV